MSIVLPERKSVEEYMMVHATMPTRAKGAPTRRAHVQEKVQEQVWEQGLSAEVFETLAPLVKKQFGNKSERVNVEAERMQANDPSRLYRDEVGHADLLTSEEVVRLAQSIERGRLAAARPHQAGQRELIEAGKSAKNRLIEANLRLVIHVARRYKGFEIDLMDLIQEGNLGLMHAVE
ncbi:MAG: sigma factor, partial [Ktedonobacteraceae bacterium]